MKKYLDKRAIHVKEKESEVIRKFVIENYDFISENGEYKTLDFGCGRYRHSLFLYKFFPQKTIGYDIQIVDDYLAKMYALAGDDFKFVLNDLEKVFPALQKQKYIIVCTLVFMFLENALDLVRNIDAVSEKDSFFVYEFERKSLSFGKFEDTIEVENLLKDLGWEICKIGRKYNVRKHQFIARKL